MTEQIGPITYVTDPSDPNCLSDRHIYLLQDITVWWDDEDRLHNILVPLLNQTYTLSLRIIDWCVTNYSKAFPVTIETTQGTLFNLYYSYKLQLRCHKRNSFDPFRRRNKIWFQSNGKEYHTTPAQLNFLKWVVENNILDYCQKNKKKIEDHMIESLKKSKIVKKKTKQKRITLTKIKNQASNIFHVTQIT